MVLVSLAKKSGFNVNINSWITSTCLAVYVTLDEFQLTSLSPL